MCLHYLHTIFLKEKEPDVVWRVETKLKESIEIHMEDDKKAVE